MEQKETSINQRDCFLYFFSHLKYDIMELKQIIPKSLNVLDSKSYIIINLEKMSDIIKSIEIILNSNLDNGSALILLRSVVENYTYLYFLYFSPEDDGIKEIRRYLFFMDGLSAYINRNQKVINNKRENIDVDKNIQAVKDNEESLCWFKNEVLLKPMCSDALKRVIGKNKYPWRFKDINTSDPNKIVDMMELAYNDKITAVIFQDLLSQYVHGLPYSAVSHENNIFSDEDIYLALNATIDKIITYIEKYFSSEVLDNKIDFSKTGIYKQLVGSQYIKAHKQEYLNDFPDQQKNN